MRADPAPVHGKKSTSRSKEIIAAARSILESEGATQLTMRRLAADVGIKAPSLYKHFPDKEAVEIAIIEEGFAEWTAAMKTAVATPGDPVISLGRAYRTFAREHPHLYTLITVGQLPRDRLTPGIEEKAGRVVGNLFADPNLARAAWAFAHGMTILELDGRFPLGADLDAAWTSGLQAFSDARIQRLQLQPQDRFES